MLLQAFFVLIVLSYIAFSVYYKNGFVINMGYATANVSTNIVFPKVENNTRNTVVPDYSVTVTTATEISKPSEVVKTLSVEDERELERERLRQQFLEWCENCRRVDELHRMTWAAIEEQERRKAEEELIAQNKLVKLTLTA